MRDGGAVHTSRRSSMFIKGCQLEVLKYATEVGGLTIIKSVWDHYMLIRVKN
jgi:hypothetical protein